MDFEGSVARLDRLEGGRDAAAGQASYEGRTVAVEVEGVLTPARVDVRIRPADASPVFVHAVPDQGALSAREAVLRRDASGLSLGVGTIELPRPRRPPA
ncbi:MAG: hypothetical protein R3F43_03310 [bacterium]